MMLPVIQQSRSYEFLIAPCCHKISNPTIYSLETRKRYTYSGKNLLHSRRKSKLSPTIRKSETQIRECRCSSMTMSISEPFSDHTNSLNLSQLAANPCFLTISV